MNDNYFSYPNHDFWSEKQTEDTVTLILSEEEYNEACEELGYFWTYHKMTSILPFHWLKMLFGFKK